MYKSKNEQKFHFRTSLIVRNSIVISAMILIGFSASSQSQRLGSKALSSGRYLADKKTETLTTPSGAVATEWNQTAVALSILPASALAPVQQTRAIAIVQVAVHDAVSGITGRYATYLPRNPAPDGASPEAAAIAAAHYALVSLFPTQAASLNTLYAASLASHGLAISDPGVAYGESAAAAILAARANDNAPQAQFDYTAPGAGTPGIWTRINNAPALLPGWGNVTPWVLRSSSQFRPDAPPPLDSDLYARDYNEIKEIGRATGSTRTAEQSNIALFWRASPVAIWNPMLAQVIAARDLDLSAAAQAYALVAIAGVDAGISCWDAKYVYNNWRPQLAIRGGDFDGNDATVGDPSWTAFLPTPPHPDYTSGHTTVSTAMASILENEFGNEPGVHFSVTQTAITREWDTFDEAVQEVIDARVYSGIHFRNSDVVGSRVGGQVGQFVLTHSLRRCPRRLQFCS